MGIPVVKMASLLLELGLALKPWGASLHSVAWAYSRHGACARLARAVSTWVH